MKQENWVSNELIKRFSNDYRKTKTKSITPTNHNRSKLLDEPITTPGNYPYLAQSAEKSHVHSAIGFGLVSRWFKNWRDPFKPITKRSNRNHVITFDSHLKTPLKVVKKISKVIYAIPLSITRNTWA